MYESKEYTISALTLPSLDYAKEAWQKERADSLKDAIPQALIYEIWRGKKNTHLQMLKANYKMLHSESFRLRLLLAWATNLKLGHRF